jgi:internalin A
LQIYYIHLHQYRYSIIELFASQHLDLDRERGKKHQQNMTEVDSSIPIDTIINENEHILNTNTMENQDENDNTTIHDEEIIPTELLIHHLSEIDTIIFDDKTIYNYTRCNISGLGLTTSRAEWNKFPLRFINVSHNSIRTIESFNDLTSLQNLNLSYNELCDIDELNTLSALQLLQVDHNKLRSFPRYSQPLLVALTLSHNELTTLLPRAESLPTFSNLSLLDLSYNQLTSLNGIESCSSLQILLIQGNKLQTLEFIEKIPNLERLDASSVFIIAITILEIL